MSSYDGLFKDGIHPKVMDILVSVAQEHYEVEQAFKLATQWIPEDDNHRANGGDPAGKWYMVYSRAAQHKGTSTRDVTLRKKLEAIAEQCHAEDAEPYVLAGYFDADVIKNAIDNDIDPSLLGSLANGA